MDADDIEDRPRRSGPADELPYESGPRDDRPFEPPSRAPSAEVAPVVVPRWIQLVVLPISLLGLWALARAAGPVLLIFLVAAVVALILNPLVELIQRGRLRRGLAVLTVYIGFFVVLAGVTALLVNPVSNQVQAFQRDVPALTRSANHSLANLQSWLDDHGFGIHVKKQGETALKTLQHTAVKRSGDLVSFTSDLVTKVISAAFGLILVLVISVYMLLYGNRIGGLVRSVMPRGDGSSDDDYPLRVQKAVSSYVRGQLLFSITMGVSAGALLYGYGALGIFPDGRRYALFFGAFFALMELVPYVGPVLGALPPIIVALFNDPLTALWVGLLFLALQQLEGHVVAPQIFGHSLRINPLLVIFSLLLGAELYGIVGAFIALPIAAVARETVIYLRRHLVLESWGTPAAPSAGAAGAAGGGTLTLPGAMRAEPGRAKAVTDAPVERACPACGAPASCDDGFCRACGTPLRAPEPARR